MSATPQRLIGLNSGELAILLEVLESERSKLMIEIRHTDHRAYRDDLRRRLTLLEGLIARCNQPE
jgi:hypothetical protein